MRGISTLLFVSLLTFSAPAGAANGYVRLGFKPLSLIPDWIFANPDGSLIVGGTSSRPGDMNGFITKLTPTGTLDRAFGTDGWVHFEELPQDMKVLPDGRILMAGA